MDYMDKVEHTLEHALRKAATVLREARSSLPRDPATQLEEMANQVAQPCIVAVVGQVKAGKSSFVNALLRDDLAKVGTSETTATINQFRYSKGAVAPERTVRCFYRTGQSSYVDKAFLDSLQGNDTETLRRSAGIDHLEYYLHSSVLERVTLVDTPGTNAAVDEHQDVTAEFLRLYQQLRDRHDKETRQLADTADAVIYLIGAVAGSVDQKFLEAFHELTQGKTEAFNAIGVMSKIDLYPQVMERRDELSAKIAGQLKENLNTVVPISAGIRRVLDGLLVNNRAGLQRLIEALSSIAPGKFDRFFSNANLYLRVDPDWPVPIEQRKELRNNIEWRVFATIARVAMEHGFNLEATAKELNALAGFDRLRNVLDTHIFERSRLLRCYSKVNQARRVLDELRYLPLSDKHDGEGKAKLARYLKFIQRAASGDAATAQEIRALVEKSLVLEVEPLDTMVDRLDRDLADIFHELEHYNEDFGALQKVIRHDELFSPAEVDELRLLLGLYGLESAHGLSLEYVKERQSRWRRISMRDMNSIRQDVARQAADRYGLIQKKFSGE